MTLPSFLDLARRGLIAPLATDLVLHEDDDPEAVRRDGAALADVLIRAAERYSAPLALPLMDLRLDKADALGNLGMNEFDADRFHFDGPLDVPTRETLMAGDGRPSPGSVARDEALQRVACRGDLIPVGMTIGPFSLATKLLADPITAAALLGTGVGPESDSQVSLLLDALAVAEAVVNRSIRRQIEAGAQAMLVCEPAASVAFLSPRQIAAGSDVFDRLVLTPNLAIKKQLDTNGVDLVFHDCGELTTEMVAAFGRQIAPTVLSLGSSRMLPEDAARVPDSVILYGNLPSKSFYSDAVFTVDDVRERAADLIEAMSRTGHPFILGTECDVLHVPEASVTIRLKVDAMLAASGTTPRFSDDRESVR